MTTMTITIERTHRTLNVGGKPIQVEELGLCLPFARKPADLSEVGGSGSYRVFVTETREISTIEFDAFAAQLLLSREWLSGKGGYAEDGRLCVEISAPGRPILFVDPSGCDYARYVARLG
jgi:hypothetical protein